MPVQIDADKLRGYVPSYATLARSDPDAAFAASQADASRWADALRDAAVQAGLDVVSEGLFKTRANNVTLMIQLEGAGYERGSW